MNKFTTETVSIAGAPAIHFDFRGDVCRAELAGAKLYVEAGPHESAWLRITDAKGEVLADLLVKPRSHRTLTENIMDVGSALLWSHWRYAEANKKQTLVMQAIGEASMCWSQTPAGVFDSEKAIAIGERLLEQLDGKS